MQTTNDIRTGFLNYFQSQGHRIVDSGPLVPRNDPTLLFTNAGMVQFKNLFTGTEMRDYQRAVTSQKCVRAGGKHNDLENVGYTARHHTFFEMLGNFSFGDYFKENAIEFAWNLITKEFGLSDERLLVTVYADDEDAAGLWRKIAGLSDDRIIRIATSDNFWAMGDTGPCGPCSEIFYDHGDHIPGGPPGSPDEDGDRFIEIWNLVFMQFEQVSTDQRINLPKPSIDTGMGLERIAAVMQGVHDNYDIDLMRSLIDASAAAANVDPDGDQAVSHRVIADHLRAASFLIADGVLPSNEGRGYVLRRIMRRAMRHVHILGVKDPMMWRIVPALSAQMGQAFPELRRAESLITETLKLEEGRFKETLDRGLRILADETDKLGDGETLSGSVAFRLYDTYGFPLDLTQDILRGQGRGLDQDGFDVAMAEQKAAARKAWAGSGEAATETLWFDLREQLGATEFLGYETTSAEGEVVALVADGQVVQHLNAGQAGAVIVNQTPFYGESGGQVGDQGQISSAAGFDFAVADVSRKLGDLVVHLGTVNKGQIAPGDAVELLVDSGRRDRLRANHSATHLLHEALRDALGDHVTQKGSLVEPGRLRFDFSHPKTVTAEQLTAVEATVNSRILANDPVLTRLMSPEEAIAAGALALFGEKYGEEVRVVSMGGSAQSADRGAPVGYYSTELCGGTHVTRMGDIGQFRITSEGAVASGVRRIEAVTAGDALRYAREREALLLAAADHLKANIDQVPDRIAALQVERRRLDRELTEARKKLASGGGTASEGAATKTIAGYVFAGRILDDVPARDLRGMADALKQQVGSGIVAIASADQGKASLVVGVTEDLTETISAVELVRVGAAALGGGGGGGRADMAQAGGPEASQTAAAIAAIEEALAAVAG
jgi:alanyl-tRNA synthetase